LSLPEVVRIVEVGPRDGFQMEDRFLPTELKVEVIDRLSAAGLREIESTSFVHPRVIPQMADAAEVMGRISRRPGVRFSALVPNLQGARRALAAGADELRLVICCSETYNRRNVGLTVAQSIDAFGDIARQARAASIPASAVLAVAFGCPFEGDVPPERVVAMAREVVDLGSDRVGVADSAGLANPRQVGELVGDLAGEIDRPMWLHLHDTRGMGLANAVAGMEAGIDTFDTSLGGLGGCPVMIGASGNVATEDLCYLCEEMGVATGIDLDPVREASRRLERFLGRRLPSRILAAGTKDELLARNRPSGD
jgi:hydroxymethylglutaryl-CoA lyase